jgi:hypothetical protein
MPSSSHSFNSPGQLAIWAQWLELLQHCKCLPHNLAQNERQIGLQFNPDVDGGNFVLLLLVIYRNFLTSAYIWSEQGIIEFCKRQSINVRCSNTDSWDAVMQQVAPDVPLIVLDKLRVLRPREHPSSADIRNAALNAVPLPKKRKAYWRKMFDAMDLVPNKCSHAHIDPGLTPGEVKRLADGDLGEIIAPKLSPDELSRLVSASSVQGLGAMPNGRTLQFAAKMMPTMMNRLPQFFGELEAASVPPAD